MCSKWLWQWIKWWKSLIFVVMDRWPAFHWRYSHTKGTNEGKYQILASKQMIKLLKTVVICWPKKLLPYFSYYNRGGTIDCVISFTSLACAHWQLAKIKKWKSLKPFFYHNLWYITRTLMAQILEMPLSILDNSFDRLFCINQ